MPGRSPGRIVTHMTAEILTEAATAIRDGKVVVASTGAGISTESGIPDFRSANGIWARYPPEEYATIQAFMENPDKLWSFWRELGDQIKGCAPNPGHHALSQLERSGNLTAVITQNVDNLHQEAGSRNVVEYHGNSREVICLSCGNVAPLNPELEAMGTPFCVCSGIYKPNVVLFGEMIPPRAMLQAEAYAQSADVVIVVGTSAQVFPAAQLPLTAKERGATIIEVNLERTDFTESITDHFLQGKSGDVLPRLAAEVVSG